MLRISWAYSLKLDDLMPHFYEFNLDTNGIVEELRKRFAEFISSTHSNEVTTYLMALQEKYEKLNTTPTLVCTHAAMNSNIIEQVNKWQLAYDGGPNPLAFTDRLEELAEIYEISLNKLPKFMPLFLNKRALVWLRNNNAHWQEWRRFKIDFLEFFLPSNHFEKLEKEICARVQRSNEVFKYYVLAIQELMRHTNMSEEQKLDRILSNSRILYQCYIKRTDFSSLGELIRLAKKFENKAAPLQTSCQGRSTQTGNTEPPEKRRKFSISQTSLTSGENRLTATLLMAGKWVTAVIDTATGRNFIRKEFIRNLKIDPSYTNLEMDVVLADGSIMPVSSAVNFETTMGGVSRKCRFLVMNEANEDVIVGLDFLRQFNTALEIAGLRFNCDSLEATQIYPSSKTFLLPSMPSSTPSLVSPTSTNNPLSSIFTTEAPTSTFVPPTSTSKTDEAPQSSTNTKGLKFEGDLSSLPEELQRRIEDAHQNKKVGKRLKFRCCINETVYSVTFARSGIISVHIKPFIATTTYSSEQPTSANILHTSTPTTAEEYTSTSILPSGSLAVAKALTSIIIPPVSSSTIAEEYNSTAIRFTSAPEVTEAPTSVIILPTSTSTMAEAQKFDTNKIDKQFEGDFASLPAELQLQIQSVHANWKPGKRLKALRCFEDNMYRVVIAKSGLIKIYKLGLKMC